MTGQHLPPGPVNIGEACSTWPCEAGLAGRTALRWLAPDLQRTDYSFRWLDESSNRFANVMQGLGMRPGEVLFTLLPKSPEQFFTVLGSLKHHLITSALFSNFGDDALLERMADAGARLVVTRKNQLRKLDRIRTSLPRLAFILVADIEEDQSPQVLSLPRLLREASPMYHCRPAGPGTPAMLHYTASPGGRPRGALHTHGALASHRATALEVLGLQPDDVYWCTADQGWVTGISYGVFGPWSLGVTQVHFGGGFLAETWLTILERERISVWYTAPTVLRMLKREDPALFSRFDLSALRWIAGVGEYLEPEICRWAMETFGRPVADTYFQTESGAILIASRPGMEIRPGSMGFPVSGIEAAILDEEMRPLPPEQEGQLAIRPGWPSMFREYLNRPADSAEKVQKGWYLTADRACRDRDGYYWFKGRLDGIINTAGHLVSPAEVEEPLRALPEIADAAVAGIPDEILLEKIAAFLVLAPGVEWNGDLEMKIRLHLSKKVSTIATPQVIQVRDRLPRDAAGRIDRRQLLDQISGA